MEVKDFRQFLWRASKGKSSPEVEKILDGLEARKLKAETSFSSDINESKQRVYNKVMFRIGTRKRNALTPVVFKYAAAIMFIIATSLTIWQMRSGTSPQKQLVMIQITTKAGERKTVILPDSSTVVLNSQSLLSYPEKFMGKERNVSLKGEAFFKVKKNPRKPFNVHSSEITTTVLGTSFNILEAEGDVTVTVATGKVKVMDTNKKDGVVLFPDEQVLFNTKTSEFILKKTDANYYSGWSKGYIFFNNMKLEKAFTQLEKWYNVSIECNSPEISNRTIQSKYQNESLEFILKDMEFIFDLKYEYINDTSIVIKK